MAVSTLLLCARSSVGAPADTKDKAECIKAYEGAQSRVRAGHLRESQEWWLGCAKAMCGPLLRQECTTRGIEVESDIPSIVLRITTQHGAPLGDIQVRMDGELLTARLDGRSLAVDPGLHEFSFGTESRVLTTVKIMIVQGEHDRAISVSIPAPSAPARAAVVAPPPVEPTPEAVPSSGSATPGLLVLPFAVGGLVGAGAAASLYAFGKQDTPSLATDATIGVSVAALVVATWLFATPHKQETAPRSTAYVFDVRPGRSGAFASVSRAF